MYYKGLERIGCWVCPSMDLAEMRVVEEIMGPSWHEYLKKMSKSLSLSEQELKQGLWRWRFKSPGWLESRGEKTHKRRAGYLYGKKIRIEKEDDFKRLLSILKTMYEVHEEGGQVTLLDKGRSIAILMKEEEKIIIEAESRHWLKIFRGIARALACVKCMLCFATCPNEAIEMGQKGVEVSTEKCTACGECNYTCPVWAYSLKAPHIAKRLLE